MDSVVDAIAKILEKDMNGWLAGVLGIGVLALAFSAFLQVRIKAEDAGNERMRKISDAIRLIGDATATVSGRKNLVLLSWGFGEAGAYGSYYPDPRYYPNMIQTLNDQNVAVYSIDLISTTRQGTLMDRGVNQSLSLLSDDTGGRYYFHFDTFASPLSQVNQENNGYYMLSFSAQHPAGDHGYREVQVRTVNPTFKVRARKGYRYGA